jgi:hypothetical protein
VSIVLLRLKTIFVCRSGEAALIIKDTPNGKKSRPNRKI